MDLGAFGRAEYNYSDPTPAGAKVFTSQGDLEWQGESRQYKNTAYSGMMVPVDPKVLKLQVSALKAGMKYDTGVRTLISGSDPGFYPQEEGIMQDDFMEGSADFMEKYQSYIIAGSVLVAGLSLIYFMRS